MLIHGGTPQSSDCRVVHCNQTVQDRPRVCIGVEKECLGDISTVALSIDFYDHSTLTMWSNWRGKYIGITPELLKIKQRVSFWAALGQNFSRTQFYTLI